MRLRLATEQAVERTKIEQRGIAWLSSKTSD